MYNYRMQSSKAFKYCKYCRMSDHFIDTCPEILCKKCNDRGHPHWKCTKKRNIGHAFDDKDSNNSTGSTGSTGYTGSTGSTENKGGFRRAGNKSDTKSIFFIEVVEEEEVEPKMKIKMT